MRVYCDRATQREKLQSKYRAFPMGNVDDRDRIAFLWGHSTYLQPGFKGRISRRRQSLEDFLGNRLRLSA